MKSRSRKIKLVIVFVVLFLCWVFIAPFLAEKLIVKKTSERADAIFILSGSATYIERCQQAATDFKQGIAPKIFLTNDGLSGGWNQQEQRNPYFSELAKRELIKQGVPENAIETLPEIVNGTKDEADLFVKTFQERNLHSVLLITSAYHSRRTLRMFEEAVSKESLSIEIGIHPASAGQQTPTIFVWWLTPSGWKWVGGEYLKILYYQFS